MRPAGTGAGRPGRVASVASVLVVLLIAGLAVALVAPEGPGVEAGRSAPTATALAAPTPIFSAGPSLSPLSVGTVARSVLVNYNASWNGTFLSSVDDWSVGPGTYVPSTGDLWLSDLPARHAPGPLPRYAPAILFDTATNSFAGVVPELTNTSDLVYDPANGLIYAADPLNNTVGVFNPATDAWVTRAIPTGVSPTNLVLDASTGSLFVANYGSANLSVIDTATNAVSVRNIGTGSEPFSLALDPINQTLYVARANSNQLSVVNATTFAVISTPTFVTPGYPSGLAFSAPTYSLAAPVPGADVVTVFNATDGATTSTIHGLGPGLGAVAAVPSNSDFLVAFSGGANLAEINPTSGTVANASIGTGASPASFDTDPVGADVYVWSSVGRTLTHVWSNGKPTSVSSPSLGSAPSSIAFDQTSGRIIVANSNDSTLSFLSAGDLATAASPLKLTGLPLALGSDGSSSSVYVGLENGITSIDANTGSILASNSVLTGATEAVLVDPPDGVVWALNSIHGLVSYSLGLSTSGTVGLGAGQTGVHTLALDPTSDRLFVPVNNTGTAGIAVVNANDGAVVNASVASVPGLTSLVYDPADGDVYALGTALYVLNATSLSLVGPGINVAPHTSAGVVVYDPSRSYVYATTLNGPNSTGVLTVVDGTSAAASYSSEVNLAVGEGPVAATAVDLSGAAGGTSEIWIADSVAGTAAIVASSPPSITGFEAVPSTFDLGGRTTLDVTTLGGAGTSSYSYTGLPNGCTSENTDALNCTPTSSGTYSVTVTVTDELGDSATALTNVTIKSGLTASATFHPGTFPTVDTGSLVSMVANASGGEGPYQFSWAFGDSTGATGSGVTHAYSTPGDYILTVSVSDALGGLGTESWAVRVNPVIAVNVSAPALATDVHRAVAFSATVSGGTDPNSTVQWSFGDGTSLTSATATHEWATAGTYNVTAHAQDADGGFANRSVEVVVNSALSATFTTAGGSSAPPQPGYLFFCNASASGGTGPLSIAWQFGDGTGASGASVSHAYASAGNFTVNVTVTDAVGASVNGTFTLSVLPPSAPPSGGSSLPFSLGVFLGIVIGAAAGAVLVFVAARPRKPQAPPPPSPYVAPARVPWKEE
jgi:YVTN family beta-propeller protein